MKRTFLFLLASALTASAALAQQTVSSTDEIGKKVEVLENEVSKLKKFKVSGYIQGQFQWGQDAASLKVGKGNETSGDSFSRFGIRRGRVKFTFESGITSAVFQLDITEKGVGFKDAYANIKDPWIGAFSLRGGIFDRPFGYEISYSSSRRESPERSTIFQTLFPDERDLGGMLIIQAPSKSPWNILKLEAGLFAGNGIKQENDSRRDFIGHLSLAKDWKNLSLGAGVSYYNGSVFQGTENVYTMTDNKFTLNTDADNKGAFAKREYFGFDARFSLKSIIGKTQLRGEYLFGQQPGLIENSKSPNSADLPTKDTYIRNFSGGYVMLVQDLGKSPVSLVAKYDWYDPNTKVSENEIGVDGTHTGKADIAVNTIGFGALWNVTPDVRLTAYYDLNKNEKSTGLEGYGADRKDNVFTLRLQYKF